MSHDDMVDDVVHPETMPGFDRDDLVALEAELPGGQLSAAPGFVGKGGAGPGVELVWHLTEEVLTDGASLLAVGSALWRLVHRVQQRRQRPLQVQDPMTIAARAAASAQHGTRELLREARWLQTVCLTGGGPGMGTDDRDIWATSSQLPDANVLVLLSAPSGLLLQELILTPAWRRT